MDALQPADPRLILLGLLGGPPADFDVLTTLRPQDWARLDAMVVQHRLGPLLHGLWSSCDDLNALSGGLLHRWAAAHRASGMAALAMRADLLATVRILDGKAIPCAALKGSWLGWHAYPAPALRPMRDIDVLVGTEMGMAAWECLLQAGYRQMAEPDMAFADLLKYSKHLPPLRAPGGTMVEIHMRPWETALPSGHVLPVSTDFLARAAPFCADDPVAYPCGHDMVKHLIIHGVMGQYRLDAGPLLLADLAYCARSATVDWAAFWKQAREEGWQNAACLAFCLTCKWRDEGILELVQCPEQAPKEHILQAEQLITQRLELRSQSALLSAISGPRKWRQFWNRLSGRRLGQKRHFGPDGGYVGWLGRRIRENLGTIADREIRSQAKAVTRLSAWLNRN